MHKSVSYEYPLNERVRSLLRLEHLFKQVAHFIHRKSIWDSRITVISFMEILDIFGRGDLKTELLKEMERAASNLEPLLDIPEVDSARLETVLKALQRLRNNLNGLNGKLGQALREDELLASVRQRTTIPGGTCDFDLPRFHAWLERPAEQRHEDLDRWHETLDEVRQPVELLLKLMRNSANAKDLTAENGFYQQALDTNSPFQMLRITLPVGTDMYPEVSGGKHRFSIRFLKRNNERAVPMEEDISFKLSCCSL